ncbi:amino acid adenylation domain-containing protein [Actinomadura rugatobispora]|uniref:Amino acid adenylation domain-containing protein n=1 Tax=Actinomadura rugatobispora TaxID=1994 RepID=A0ABW0ZZV6_9ACTN|nr:D-alanine--poly(phosphoribitol) ligase [Actinomadura rugatobispora]
MAPDRPEQRLLHEAFLWNVERDGSAEALRVGGESISYGRLHERALRLAGGLLFHGPGTAGEPLRVGVLGARSEDAYAGLLAALYTGAAVVPLNPAFPPERLRHMIGAASLDGLIVDDKGMSLLPELADALDGVPVVHRPTVPALDEPLPSFPGDIAYILFTSGSSGRPKGVPVRHSNVVAYLRQIRARYGFTCDDVFSQTFDLTFDLAMFDIFAGWGAGGTVVSVPPHVYVSLPDFVARHGITVWFSTPNMISLVRRGRGLERGSMPGLRWSLFCGEALLVQDAARWQEAAPNSRLENLYGPTELTISCSVHRFDPERSARLAVNDIVPIGAVHPRLPYLLLGAEQDGDGTGELCVTGEQMFSGYLDRADDAGRFLDHEGRRWYRTGDLVRRVDGGELAYLGRADHQVKIGGFRVELAEVESGLRRLPGVRDAAAVAVDGRLVAFLVGDERPVPVLMKELGSFFPRYLIPRHYEYLDDLPLNANRKTDRPELTARARALLSS